MWLKRFRHSEPDNFYIVCTVQNSARLPGFSNTERRLCLYYKITSDYLLGLTDSKHAPLTIEEAKEKMISSKEMEIIGNLLDWFEKNQNKKGKDV